MTKIIVVFMFLATSLAPREAVNVKFFLFEEMVWVKTTTNTWELVSQKDDAERPEGTWVITGTTVTFPYEGSRTTFDVGKFIAVPENADWMTATNLIQRKSEISDSENPVTVERKKNTIVLSQRGDGGLFSDPLRILWSTNSTPTTTPEHR